MSKILLVIATMIIAAFCLPLIWLSAVSNQTTLNEKHQVIQSVNPREKYIDIWKELKTSFCDRLKAELDVHCIEDGGNYYNDVFSSTDDDTKISNLNLSFRTYRRASVEEARALTIFILDEFQKTINESERIRPFLENYPLGTDRIGFGLDFLGFKNVLIGFNDERDWINACDGTVSRISKYSFNDMIILFACQPFSSARTLSEESFQEMKDNSEQNSASLRSHVSTVLESQMAEILERYLLKIKDNKIRYELAFGGEGGLGGHYVKAFYDLGLNFLVYKKVATIEEGRKMMIETVMPLLELIEKDEKLRPYLLKQPPLVSRLRIIIKFVHNRGFVGASTYDGDVLSQVELVAGKIVYWKSTQSQDAGKKIATETWEAALRDFKDTSN